MVSLIYYLVPHLARQFSTRNLWSEVLGQISLKYSNFFIFLIFYCNIANFNMQFVIFLYNWLSYSGPNSLFQRSTAFITVNYMRNNRCLSYSVVEFIIKIGKSPSRTVRARRIRHLVTSWENLTPAPALQVVGECLSS